MKINHLAALTALVLLAGCAASADSGPHYAQVASPCTKTANIILNDSRYTDPRHSDLSYPTYFVCTDGRVYRLSE